MTRLKKIVNLVILLPLGVLLVVLSVANRQSVTLALNPFRPQDSVLSLTAPFFLFLLLALILGMAIGSLGTWWSQGKHRRQARVEAREAIKWHNEADKQKTPSTTVVPVALPPAGQPSTGLPPAGVQTKTPALT